YDGENIFSLHGRRLQCCRCPSTGPKIPMCKRLKLRLSLCPLRRDPQTLSQEINIKNLPAIFALALLKKVQKKCRKPRLDQDLCDKSIARTLSAASTSMCKDDKSLSSNRNSQITS